MTFPPSFLDELRTRVSIRDVVGRKVTWDRKKSNPRRRDWWACCPFHHEKSPSFHVKEDEGWYHCFGCGVSGNVIAFQMKTQNMDFLEAVEALAGEAGLEVPRSSSREKLRASLHDVMDLASNWFQDQFQTTGSAAARDYMIGRRGLTGETIAKFGLGYAPGDGAALVRFLASREITLEQMEEAGLIIRPEDGRPAFSRFRDRIMFPIEDPRGRVIAFGGRAMASDAKAKYLNSPETLLFSKSHILYNFQRARAASQDAGTIVVCEGYMDVIALDAAGMTNAVSPLGTALTEDQMNLLWRCAGEPVLCFDGDAAGQRAAHRSIDLALAILQPGRSFRFAMLPGGQDPDDLLRAEGMSAMRAVLSAARPMSSVLWERERDAEPLDTPEARAGLGQRLRQTIAQIGNDSVRHHYEQAMRDHLGTLFRPERGERRPAAGKKYNNVNPGASAGLKRSLLARPGARPGLAREKIIVATVLRHPPILDAIEEDFAAMEFSDPALDRLRGGILQMISEGSPLDETALLRHLTSLDMNMDVDRLLASGAVLGAGCVRAGASLEEAEFGFRRASALHQQARMLNADLMEAKAALAKEGTEDNIARLQAIQMAIRSMELEEAALAD